MKGVGVIQIIDSLNLGGAETLAVNLSNTLAEKGFQSHLCCTRKEGRLKASIHKKVNYLFLNRSGSLGISGILKLKKYIEAHEIEILHAHSTSIVMATIIRILLRKKVKLIWHIHSGAYIHLKGFKLRVYDLCSKYMHSIVSVNKSLLSWSARFPVKNRYVLNNFPSFMNHEKETFLNGELGKRIVCLAGLREEKDHLTLFRALNLIKDDIENWTLHIVGNEYHNDYSISLYDYVIDNGLEEQVFFYGGVIDIKHVLEQSEIGVLSSKSEGFPISALEYGLAKLAVLATEAGQLREIIEDERVICKREDPEEYAKKLKNLINNANLRNEIAVNFYQRVVSNYSKESFIEKLQKIYQK